MASENIHIPNDIYDFLIKNKVLTLATYDKELWVCTLYYGIDSNANLYCVTDPNSIHGKMIESNNRVAFNIFDSHTKITTLKKGIQGKGVMNLLRNVKDIAYGLALWHKNNPGIESNITLSDVKKWKDTKVYIITPTYLKYFNKDLYKTEEYGIWERHC